MSAILSCQAVADRFDLRRRGRFWRGTCPACQYAGDTFSMVAARDGQPRPYCANGCDQDTLARAIGQEPRPRDPAEDTRTEAARARKSALAVRLFAGSVPAPGTPVARYLTTRHIGHLVDCPNIRFRADTWHREGGKMPAMVALVRDVAGQPIAVHRTYLARDGARKADVEPAKASLGPVGGGSIRLASVAAELAIGEGIETAAAAGLLAGIGAWAAISAGNLEYGLVLPVAAGAVVIAVDRDAAGEKAARGAARRWRAEGRHVRLLVPDLPGQDAADVLAARRADQEAMRAGFLDAERERIAGEVAHA